MRKSRPPQPKKRPSREAWADARASREAIGTSFEALAKKLGVTQQAVCKRAKTEGWSDGRNLEPIIVQKALAKVYAGAEVGGTTGATTSSVEILEAEAQRRADVLLRHQREWDAVRAVFGEAVKLGEDGKPAAMDTGERYQKGRAAKVVAEALTVIQMGERRAYGLGALDTLPDDGKALLEVRRVPRSTTPTD